MEHDQRDSRSVCGAGDANAAKASHSSPRVAILTLGCKLNQAESEAIGRDFSVAGWRITDRAVAADAFVVNTCAVTQVAARKSRHLIRLARRLAPAARVAVTGCYVETDDPARLRSLGADLVLGNGEKAGLARRLLDGDAPLIVSLPSARLRTRSFLKVQEGCDDVCSFCVVPRTRGRPRSVPPAEVLRLVQSFEREGVKEVVLTGSQLGIYGHDLDGGAGLTDLIESLLRESSVPRLRVSSLRPADVTPPLLALWEDRRLCRHFHIALQSGSDAVLARMRRRYRAGEFHAAVAAIREALPGAAVTTDVLVGFPGETEDEFEETHRFCEEAGFAALHVFPFSCRPGTLAAKVAGQVPEPVKRERAQAMLELGQRLAGGFRRRFLGETLTVLWETGRPGANGDTVWEGLTDNYIRVFTASAEPLADRLLPVSLSAPQDTGLWGQLLR